VVEKEKVKIDIKDKSLENQRKDKDEE